MRKGDEYTWMNYFEDRVSGERTVEFGALIRKITIRNDSRLGRKLRYKLSNNFKEAIVRPGESFDFDLKVREITLLGNNVPYRIWVFS